MKTTRIVATAPVVTGQGHRLQRGDLIAVCDAPQAAELLGDLGRFTVVNVPGGFELRQQNQFGETVDVEFHSPLTPPIESGTLSAMWRTGLAAIEKEEAARLDQDPEVPDQDPDVDDQDPEVPDQDPELDEAEPSDPNQPKAKRPRKPKR